MNTQKAVYNRLFVEAKKTKLESQKIELGLVDDLKKQDTDGKSFVKEVESEIKKVNSLWEKFDALEKKAYEAEEVARTEFDKLENKIPASEKFISRMDKLYEKIESASKELGLNPKEIKGFASWNATYDKVYGLEQKIKSIS